MLTLALVVYSPAQGTGTLTGKVYGHFGSNVRLVYRTLPVIVERGNGWEQTRPGPSHTVRLRPIPAKGYGTFSVVVPGCPAAARAIGCAGTTYEAWATSNGLPCSETSLVMNVTTGETVNVEYMNKERQKPESLVCRTVRRH